VDDICSHAANSIERLELELVVRDFIDVLNDGDGDDISAFLHERVHYRPSPRQVICGRAAVLAMLADVREAFDSMSIRLDTVSVCGQVAVVEQTIELALPGAVAQTVMGFASFGFVGFQIAEWHQVHA